MRRPCLKTLLHSVPSSTKSLTKAGKELVSTPVITRRLARLEKSLNTRLIQRTTRRLLTEAGELFTPNK